MHNFLAKTDNNTYIRLKLCKEYDTRLSMYFYRFVNLKEDTIFPELFTRPSLALDWLDEFYGEGNWSCCD